MNYRARCASALAEEDMETLYGLAVEMALKLDKKSVSKTLANKQPYSLIEEQAWSAFPSRGSHSNPKGQAIEKLRATLRRGAVAYDVLAGTRRYAIYCENRGIVGTELVMQARRFWGSEEEWKLAWGPDTPQPTEKGDKGAKPVEGDKWEVQKAKWAVDKRRARLDGPEWWASVEQACQAQGITKYRDVLFYAQQLCGEAQ